MDAKERIERLRDWEPEELLKRAKVSADLIHHPNGSVEARISELGISAIQTGSGQYSVFTARYDVALRAFRTHWPRERREEVWRAYRTGDREKVPDPELEIELMLEALGKCYDNARR